MIRVSLGQADFYASTFYGAVISYAYGGAAMFSFADLRNADLKFGIFSQGDFRMAQLGGANLEGADFTGATVDHWQVETSRFKQTRMPDGTVRD